MRWNLDPSYQVLKIHYGIGKIRLENLKIEENKLILGFLNFSYVMHSEF